MRKPLYIVWAFLGVWLALPSAHAATHPIYRQDNVLVGANFNDGPGSSDMTLIMRIDSDPADDGWVDEGHPVKYLTNPDNDGIEEGWTQIVYDDSGWEDGESGVGFADGDDNTTTPGGLFSIWTRYYFDIQDGSTITTLTFRADYDDQFAAWLNGELIMASPGVAALIDDGDEPPFDLSSGGVPNHGSKELAAGRPNPARWNGGGQENVDLTFDFAGQTALSVEARGKLATTWSRLKTTR
ncbi:hypothetical protein HN371_11120 [Candidatus Poribacteria bacterium]|nr:hypothetical protein [Candidatus Poribacteria bacterium]MBT5531757.1 hypothetical protein [Candidatus Poribacteria bacterium]MBT7805091.1 hypothetical protein [Candidatus Poribacteria bacterium]